MSSIMVLSAFAEGDYTQKVYADENDKVKTYYSSVKQYVYDEKNNKGFYMTPDEEGKYPLLFLFHGSGYGTIGINKHYLNGYLCGETDENGTYLVERNLTKNKIICYMNKWISLGYANPYTIVLPEIDKVADPDYGVEDYRRYLMNDNGFSNLYAKINNKEVEYADSIDYTKDYSVSGYSMGGSSALYLGSKYKEIITNVGAGSPSTQYYLEDGGGWIGKESNVTFTEKEGAHLFMGYGLDESKDFENNTNRYLSAFENNKGDNPNSFKVYGKYHGKHDWPTFGRELFNFLYYLKYNELPSEEVIEQACSDADIEAFAPKEKTNDEEKKEENKVEKKDKSNINSSSNSANTTKKVEAKIEIKKGLVFTDKKTSAVYKITKVNKRKEEILGGEVTLVKTTNKKVTNLKISERIKFDGIGFNVVKVGNKAYKNCKKLKKLIIGKNIRIIGKNAFKGCKKLKRVEFRGDLIKKIGKNAFAGLNKKVKFSASIRIYEKYFNLIKKSNKKKKKKTFSI
ncbi:leucine-rich repeat protein [Eubacterium uniforme]|nr:leucine-rich repeat protein [Eubacterium uniforme]